AGGCSATHLSALLSGGSATYRRGRPRSVDRVPNCRGLWRGGHGWRPADRWRHLLRALDPERHLKRRRGWARSRPERSRKIFSNQLYLAETQGFEPWIRL